MVVLALGVPHHWHAPKAWLPGALCIHRHEGAWHVYDPPYANGFQFTLPTWEAMGGSPQTWISASPREQLYRAWRLWRIHGWRRDWPNTSRKCGLR